LAGADASLAHAHSDAFQILDEDVAFPEAADALGTAQAREHVRIGLRSDERRKAWKTIEKRRQSRDAVIDTGEMGARTGPWPVARLLNEPRPHRIERHVAYCSGEMCFVHRDRAKAALPEMASAL
jgi:hypothetical protein